MHDLGAGLLTTSPCIQGLLLFLGLGFTNTLSVPENKRGLAEVYCSMPAKQCRGPLPAIL